MSPYQKLEREYERRPRAEPFLYYVRHYHCHGFVFSRPDFFVAGRAVPKDAPVDRILDDADLFHGEDKDCWYIFAAAGNMARMWQVVPFELPWFCWTRIFDPTSTLTFVGTDRLKRRCPPDISAAK